MHFTLVQGIHFIYFSPQHAKAALAETIGELRQSLNDDGMDLPATSYVKSGSNNVRVGSCNVDNRRHVNRHKNQLPREPVMIPDECTIPSPLHLPEVDISFEEKLDELNLDDDFNFDGNEEFQDFPDNEDAREHHFYIQEHGDPSYECLVMSVIYK